jgi:hypothetical protein
MKRITVSACLLLTFVFGLPALPQVQRRNAPRSGRTKHTVANRPPKINSFTTSSSTIALCPWAFTGTCSASGLTLDVIVNYSDPDGDILLLKYEVTGGQIIGEGGHVQWNLARVPPGSYKATVTVDDQHGAKASAAINVSLEPCNTCDPPCTTLNISCPQSVEEGQSVVFSVSISGGEPDMKPTYIWSITAGTIIKGQGTSSIEVDTTGLAGKLVIATVEVGGLSPECQRTAAGDVQIRKKV